MLHNNSKPEPYLDVRNAMLVENKYTLDLIYNKIFTSEVNKSKTNLKLQVNGGTLLVNHRSNIPGYDQTVWFSK